MDEIGRQASIFGIAAIVWLSSLESEVLTFALNEIDECGLMLNLPMDRKLLGVQAVERLHSAFETLFKDPGSLAFGLCRKSF